MMSMMRAAILLLVAFRVTAAQAPAHEQVITVPGPLVGLEGMTTQSIATIGADGKAVVDAPDRHLVVGVTNGSLFISGEGGVRWYTPSSTRIRMGRTWVYEADAEPAPFVLSVWLQLLVLRVDGRSIVLHSTWSAMGADPVAYADYPRELTAFLNRSPAFVDYLLDPSAEKESKLTAFPPAIKPLRPAAPR